MSVFVWLVHLAWLTAQMLLLLTVIAIGVAIWGGIFWGSWKGYKAWRAYSRHPMAKRYRHRAYQARERARAA